MVLSNYVYSKKYLIVELLYLAGLHDIDKAIQVLCWKH